MDLKVYYKLSSYLPKKQVGEPYNYYVEGVKKLILNLEKSNDFIEISDYKISDLDQKDYLDYLFYTTNLKNPTKYGTQLLSIFGFSIKGKNDEKIVKIIDKLFKNIEKYLKHEINKKDKEKYLNKLLNELKNNHDSIKVLTFELDDKKPKDIMVNNKKLIDLVIGDYIDKILEFKKLNAECNICGYKKNEFLIKFNYFFEFATAKSKDPTFLLSDPNSKPFFICKNCVIKLFEIKDVFYLWEKIKIGNDYLTIFFYEPLNEKGFEFIKKFLNKLYTNNEEIKDLKEIKNMIEDLEREYDEIDLKYIETGLIFDILIFSKSRSERSVKKYIPNVLLKEFLQAIEENEINNKNLLNYQDFIKAIYSEKTKKLISNYYLEYLISTLKGIKNKKLIKLLTYALIYRFKEGEILSYNIMFIKLKDYYNLMSDEIIKDFAYLVGKLAKIYFIEKAKNEEGSIDWIKAKKMFSRKLLTRRYSKLRDLIDMFDYFYAKNAHIEKGVKTVEIIDKVKELNENLKIDDEVVKFYMILAFEEQKENN